MVVSRNELNRFGILSGLLSQVVLR